MRWLVILLAVTLSAAPAMAAEKTALTQGPSATVTRVVDGDTVVLSKKILGATQIRLVGIQAPKVPLGRKGFPVWPLAEASKKILQAMVLSKVVKLSFGGAKMDRHGRLLAHLLLKGGNQGRRWVQSEMLRLGMARVYTFPDNRAVAAEMLALEQEARAAKKGILGLSNYAVRTPENLGPRVGTFQLIEGTVVSAARIKARVYLNFGADWRTDFMVTLKAKARRMFKKMNIPPVSLQGKRVRMRGWLKKFNRPMIEVTHPEQIEVVEQ